MTGRRRDTTFGVAPLGCAVPVVIMGMVTTAPVPDGVRGLRSRPGLAGHRWQQQ